MQLAFKHYRKLLGVQKARLSKSRDLGLLEAIDHNPVKAGQAICF